MGQPAIKVCGLFIMAKDNISNGRQQSRWGNSSYLGERKTNKNIKTEKGSLGIFRFLK